MRTASNFLTLPHVDGQVLESNAIWVQVEDGSIQQRLIETLFQLLAPHGFDLINDIQASGIGAALTLSSMPDLERRGSIHIHPWLNLSWACWHQLHCLPWLHASTLPAVFSSSRVHQLLLQPSQMCTGHSQLAAPNALTGKCCLQVMSPVRQGIASTSSLNAALQERLNPGRPDRQGLSKKNYQNAIPQILRMGDKVLQRTNNYDKDVYNGDTGFVEDVSMAEQMLTVRFAAPGNKGSLPGILSCL